MGGLVKNIFAFATLYSTAMFFYVHMQVFVYAGRGGWRDVLGVGVDMFAGASGERGGNKRTNSLISDLGHHQSTE